MLVIFSHLDECVCEVAEGIAIDDIHLQCDDAVTIFIWFVVYFGSDVLIVFEPLIESAFEFLSGTLVSFPRFIVVRDIGVETDFYF